MIGEVLLVDDSAADNYLHKLLLEESGLVERVATVLDGQQALEYLAAAEHPPELVFLDINMPRMDGWTFLDALASMNQDFRPEMTIVMLSTSQNHVDMERAEANPLVHSYVFKPLTTDGFVELVRELA